MEREFIPYEQALALKELGFGEKCLGYFFENKLYTEESGDVVKYFKSDLTAPLYQQAFRWFREKYSLEGYINLSDSKEGDYFYYFNYINTNNIPNRREHCDFFIGNYKTYEQAELECLKKLIEIVKEKL